MNPSAALENEGAILLAQSNGCSVWQFRNATGDGTMTTYDVFPGVMLSFNDFHMEHYNSTYIPDRRILAIDHCREGRMEYPAPDGRMAYTGASDLKLDLRTHHTGMFCFPSCHYHGLTVAFDMEVLPQSLAEEMKDFPVAPEELIARFSLDTSFCILHNQKEAEPIFSELYRVPERIRIPYFKVKILELLLYLDAMAVPPIVSNPPYFYRTQVEKIKAIRLFLTEHITENFTQKELSRRFDIPMTAMKNCFRAVYGEAMGAWLVNYRMNQAAELLLRDSHQSIAEIGSHVGYDNAGKFTAAFKRVMHLTPSQYQKERGIHHGNGKG